MYQAGVKQILLLENKGITFQFYDPNNNNAITNLETLGSVITVDNNQLPEFEFDFEIGESGEILYGYSLKFYILDYSSSNISLIQQLKRTIYGWCIEIEYYDGTRKFYNTPFKCQKGSIKVQEEMSFEINLETIVPSNIRHLDYVPDAVVGQIFRADTTLLTADTTIYTADYAL